MKNTFTYKLTNSSNPIIVKQTHCFKTFKEEVVKAILVYLNDLNLKYLDSYPKIIVSITFSQNDLLYSQDLMLNPYIFHNLIIKNEFGFIVKYDDLNKCVQRYLEDLHTDLIRGYLQKQ